MSLKLERLLDDLYREMHTVVHSMASIDRMVKDAEPKIQAMLNAREKAHEILQELRQEIGQTKEV